MKALKLVLCSTALSMTIPTIALGQDEQSGQQARAQVSAGEIIVTARKREETLQDVPIVASVLSEESLTQRQITSLNEIQRIVPALSLAESNGALGTQVALRGVGTSAINANIDASVSLNVDGLQITQASSYAAAMFDLQRVEVLKGPQALFYGKNSPGGVIALRTADPTDELEVMTRIGYEGVARELRLEQVISGPVTDTLKLRLAGLYDSQDGYFRNKAIVPDGLGGLAPTRDRAPHNENWILRGTVLWEPSANFSARLKVNVTHDRTEGGEVRQFVSCPDGLVPTPGIGIPFLGGGEDCILNRDLASIYLDPDAFVRTRNNGVPFKELDHVFGTLELTYNPTPELTVTSTTGYYDMEFESQLNGSGSTFAGPTFYSTAEPLAREDFTQELRIQSDFAGPLNFLAGLYYQDAKINNTIGLPANQVLLPGTPTLLDYQHLIDIKSYSAFGQLTWQVVPELEISAGARWTEEKRELEAFILNEGGKIPFPTATPKIKSDNIAPEVTVSYKPTPDLTIFGSYKVAYKSGSFDTTALRGDTPDYAFGDEKGEGWEAGIKARLFDRSLTTSFAIYDYRYSGLQVGAVEPIEAGGIPVNRTLNAGSARVYGAELELNYAPPTIDGLTLQAAVAYTHARFKEFNEAPCWGGQTVAEGCDQIFVPAADQANPGPGAVTVDGQHGFYSAQDLSGEPLVRSPDWQATFGFTYDMPVGDNMTVTVTNSNQYSSSYTAVLGLRDDFTRGNYFKTDVSVALKGPDDLWEVALIGKNLTDKLTVASCNASNAQNGAIFGGYITGGIGRGPAGVDELGCFVERGRELWVRLTLRPFG